MVWLLVSFRRQAATDDELLLDYPGLSANDLTSAWTYYADNASEIDEAIASQNQYE